MAELNFRGYRSGINLAGPKITEVRFLEVYVDFTDTANQVAGATDSINLFQIPAKSVVLAAGVEQVVAGTAGNTLQARVGTTALSTTVASDAAAGTMTTIVTTAITGEGQTLTYPLPQVVGATAVDFNLLSASGIRATGVVRAWVVVTEVAKHVGAPSIAKRDQSL